MSDRVKPYLGTKESVEKQNKIQEDAYVLLYFSERKRWLVRAVKGRRFDTHLGYLALEELLGKEYGSKVETSRDSVTQKAIGESTLTK